MIAEQITTRMRQSLGSASMSQQTGEEGVALRGSTGHHPVARGHSRLRRETGTMQTSVGGVRAGFPSQSPEEARICGGAWRAPPPSQPPLGMGPVTARYHQAKAPRKGTALPGP